MPYFTDPVTGQTKFLGDGQALPQSPNGQPWKNSSGHPVPSGIPLSNGNPTAYNPPPPPPPYIPPPSSPWPSPISSPFPSASSYPAHPHARGSVARSGRSTKAALVLGVVAAATGLWLFTESRDAREREKDREWAIVRSQQAEAQRRSLADPRQRKYQHDLWLHGHEYRRLQKERNPGVDLGPEPPEPPK